MQVFEIRCRINVQIDTRIVQKAKGAGESVESEQAGTIVGAVDRQFSQKKDGQAQLK